MSDDEDGEGEGADTKGALRSKRQGDSTMMMRRKRRRKIKDKEAGPVWWVQRSRQQRGHEHMIKKKNGKMLKKWTCSKANRESSD